MEWNNGMEKWNGKMEWKNGMEKTQTFSYVVLEKGFDCVTSFYHLKKRKKKKKEKVSNC